MPWHPVTFLMNHHQTIRASRKGSGGRETGPACGGGESRPARTCDEPAKPLRDVTQARRTRSSDGMRPCERKEAGIASGPQAFIVEREEQHDRRLFLVFWHERFPFGIACAGDRATSIGSVRIDSPWHNLERLGIRSAIYCLMADNYLGMSCKDCAHECLSRTG
jgi:hypothetical protein